jgi:hypothetical protein
MALPISVPDLAPKSPSADLIARKRILYMKDWLQKLDEMMKINDFEILRGKSSVSHEEMANLVRIEMEKYRKRLSAPELKRWPEGDNCGVEVLP